MKEKNMSYCIAPSIKVFWQFMLIIEIISNLLYANNLHADILS